MTTPAEGRIRSLNQAPINKTAKYVLYWSQINRRVEGNHALAHAITLANQLGLPVLVYEGLTCTYREANDRIHTFVLENVPHTAAALEKLGIGYVFYLRVRRSDANDTLYRLAEDAAALVTDDFPVFIVREHLESVPAKLKIPCLAVDSSTVVPMNHFEKREWAAYTIRPKVHKALPKYLVPCQMPAVAVRFALPLPEWRTQVEPAQIPALVAQCEINHRVPVSSAFRGGAPVARQRLDEFLRSKFRRYNEDRNQPSAHATSNLSPYLHFGMISPIDVAIAARDYAAAQGLDATSFLEELIVRRELAFNFARYAGAQVECLSSLPDWARATLRKHAADIRDPQYKREQFEQALTHDDIWNAAQKELLLRGKIHGYYRMYWGKKIIEWSPTCQDALETMIALHDRYALDGRNPNTYTGILWCFGLHDRPWVERPIFGQIRYMGYEGMRRKTDSVSYLREIAHLEATSQDLLALV
ncbi:MAG: deoxyribodipyrimidine photo-lyase [Bryobacter sp.]|nr:deoxyribodipyrimidine photo-lyase [Bryobacter sp.]